LFLDEFKIYANLIKAYEGGRKIFNFDFSTLIVPELVLEEIENNEVTPLNGIDGITNE